MKSSPTFVIDIGRHRLAVWLRWNPKHFKVGFANRDLKCKMPPPGWWCSRTPGHDGPCAARQLSRFHIPGAFVAGFGFGMCTYLRRNKPVHSIGL